MANADMASAIKKQINFNNLKNEISKVPPECPVFIYIGIGTMAGLRETDGTLAQANYHQFPPFLQDLRNRYPTLHLFIVLIDPMQENPPYLLRDFNVSNVEVFVYRENVNMLPFPPNNIDIDITDNLRDLNEFAVNNNASLLYHDFTGRRTASVAEFFDSELDNSLLDQIVYGMSSREDHGCYFDLTQTNAYYAVRLDTNNNRRPIIKMFNYYKFITNNSFYKLTEEMNKYDNEVVIEWQKNQIINDISTQFKNIYIAMLRQLRKIMLNPEDPDIDPNLYLYNNFSDSQRYMFLDMWHTKEYDLLWEILYNYCADKLHVYTTLMNMNMTGEQLLNIFTENPDPYKWYTTVKMYM
jgi:hypothetical protein